MLGGIVSFGFAAMCFFLSYFVFGLIKQINDESVIDPMGLLFFVLAFSSAVSGLKELIVDPKAELLVFMAEDYLSRNPEPNQSVKEHGGHPPEV